MRTFGQKEFTGGNKGHNINMAQKKKIISSYGGRLNAKGYEQIAGRQLQLLLQ